MSTRIGTLATGFILLLGITSVLFALETEFRTQGKCSVKLVILFPNGVSGYFNMQALIKTEFTSMTYRLPELFNFPIDQSEPTL